MTRLSPPEGDMPEPADAGTGQPQPASSKAGPPRAIAPKRWSRLALAGAAAGLAAASPAGAVRLMPALPGAGAPTVYLVQAQGEGGEQGALIPATPEGGDGSLSAAIATAPGDVAFLASLGLVEAQARGAVAASARGLADAAEALAEAPEAQVMDTLRVALAAHAAPDFTPALSDLTGAVEGGAAAADLQPRLDALVAAIAGAAAVESDDPRDRLQSLVLLTNGAAQAYQASLQDGAVGDPVEWHQAWGLIQVARRLADALATDASVPVAKAGAKAAAALAEADAAFGDMTAAAPLAGDPGVLLAIAGRVEFAASAVRE